MPVTVNMAILALAHSNGDFRLSVWAAVGVVAGVYLFFRGFRMLQYKRLIINTPRSKIRSASMGLVELTGMTTGTETIPAGITRQPCYYFRATAWRQGDSGNRGWKKVASESLYVPFFVEDATGKMLVNPQGAELDLHCNFKDTFGSSFSGDMLPEDIARFLTRNGIDLSGKIRVEEYCIKPGFPLFVLGTLGENADRMLWTPSEHVSDARSTFTQAAGQMGTSLLGALGGVIGMNAGSSPSRWLGTSMGTLHGAPEGASGGHAVPSEVAPANGASKWSSVSMDEVEFSKAYAKARKQAAASAPSPAPEPRSASVATAVEEPLVEDVNAASQAAEPADTHPDVAVAKGSGGEPFIVSWRSQRDVVNSLAWKSALCIWGGPALTLTSLYLLFLTLGWM